MSYRFIRLGGHQPVQLGVPQETVFKRYNISRTANNPNLCRHVDCPEQPGINRYRNHWNREDAQTLVHGAIGKYKNGRVAVVNTLPYTMAAWGVGGGKKCSYNYDPTGHIQFEMLEDDLVSARRLPVVEEQIKVINHRVADLEAHEERGSA